MTALQKLAAVEKEMRVGNDNISMTDAEGWADELASIRAELEQQTAWRSMDSAPRDGTHFWCYSPDGDNDPMMMFDVAYFDADYDGFVKFGCGFDRVTHWRSLPLPPAPEAQG